MVDRIIPSGNEPNTEEQKVSEEKLLKVIEKIEALFKEELGENVLWFLQFRDTKNRITGYNGSGCPACAILRAIQWGLEANLKHDEGGMPFNPFPVLIRLASKDKDDILRQIFDVDDKDETKH
jgi:hypothetical protein